MIMHKLLPCKSLIHLLFYSAIFVIVAFSEQVINNKRQPWIPKIVWTWWDSAIADDNHKLKLFNFNHRMYSKGWQLRHLDYTTQQKWLKQNADYNNIFRSEYFKDTQSTRRSDLIRLIVLKHYGGIYMDYSVLLTQQLDWVLDIWDQDVLQNKFGDTPDILLIYNTLQGSRQYVKDSNGKDVLIRPTFQNSLIAAKPGGQFLQVWFNRYVQTRRESFKRWGNNRDKSIAMDFAKQNNISTFFYTHPYWQQPICAQIVMQMKQKQFDEIWEKDKSQPRQFSVKYYKIWTMGTRETAFLVHHSAGWNNDRVMERLFQANIKENMYWNSHPRYLIKLYGNIRQTFNNYWLNQTTIKQVQCPIKKFILEDSIVYQYFLKDYPVTFYSNPVVKRPQDMDCKKIQTANPQMENIKRKISQTGIKAQQNRAGLQLMRNQIQKMGEQLKLGLTTLLKEKQQNKVQIRQMQYQLIQLKNKDKNLNSQKEHKDLQKLKVKRNQVSVLSSTNQSKQSTYIFIIVISVLFNIVIIFLGVKLKRILSSNYQINLNYRQILQLDQN